MPGPSHAARVGDVFSEWARSGRGERMESSHRVTAGRVLDAIDARAGERFLDLGTGNGWAARELAARGMRAVGVDLSLDMLRRARERGGVDVVRASFEALPFRDGAFASLFGMESIYYAGDVDAALRECARVLRDGGTADLVLDYYAENDASHSWPDLTGVTMRLMPEAEWRARLRDAGFADVASARVRAPPGVGDAWLATEGSLHVCGTRPARG